MFTKIFNIFFKDVVIDLLVIYRVFQKDLANELNVDHGSISWTTQMMCKAAKASRRIGEIPGNELPRIGEICKMNPLKNGWVELCMLNKDLLNNGAVAL